METRMIHLQFCWHNPYTEPPPGLPRLLFDGVVREKHWRENKIPELVMLGLRFPPGHGYSWRVSPIIHRQTKPWSKERKAKQRQRNLRARLEKKVPLFADLFYEQEIAKNPGYYEGEEVNFRKETTSG